MTGLRYSVIASALNGRLVGADGVLESVSTDTRDISAGNVFVALQGEHFDAHAFVERAAAAGAAAVMVSRQVNVSLPQIVVADTRIGLGALAALWRQQFTLPVVAVTGSNGKTTVKEMLASILSRLGETLVTHGNLNNDIGVPLTLFRIREWHRYAVIEMGANHPGEIRYLTKMASPHVALITNAGPAHLEGFGDIEGVAKAKAEIFESLTEQGHGIINADDRYAPLWRDKVRHCQNIEFALNSDAAVHGAWDAARNQLRIETSLGNTTVNLPVLGEHNARNALAAAAAAMAVGAGLEEIRQGLEAMHAVKGRLFPRAGVGGCCLLDDTYNANPASLTAALKVICAMPGEPWLVLGDMGELGANSEPLHAQMGETARELGVKRLFATGKFSAAAVKSFGAGAEWFADAQALANAVKAVAAAGINVLVKGSRSMKMERVVAELIDQSKAGNDAGFVGGA